MKPVYLLLSVLYILHHVGSDKTSPPWKKWTYCRKQGNKGNNGCLIKAIEAVETDLINGNSYFGTPPLEPMRFNELSMFKANQANTPVAINITFKDCLINGLKDWHMMEAIDDWDGGLLKGKVHLKGPVYFLSNYTINGKILLLPINGKGKSTFVFRDMDVNMQIEGKTITKKGKKYFFVDNFDVELIPNEISINFENLFNGNKALSDTMNQFLNENWKDLLVEVKKPISEGLGAALKQFAQRVFAKIPYDELFLK